MSQSTRKLWAAKLSGTLKQCPSQEPTIIAKRIEGIILGVDPSLRGTGIAIVEAKGREWRLLHSQTLKHPQSMSMATCLGSIHRTVAEVITQYRPQYAALEQVIYVQNSRTALTMGSARGAAISAIALAGLDVCEYPPRLVKQSVSGYGAASKEQVGGQIKAFLRLDSLLPPDESDAAAVCICHSLRQGVV
ncbi:MAG: crossover junction endodeoxyribonuclease RuvC [Opitutales bacterium]|nr:crossover junction endodeoxyribonuclease RuvC [Opitutales bacterium]